MVKEYQPTHVVPATGLPAWPTPDGTGAPAATLDPGLDIQVTERRADWAHIRCSNGWEAWIDGRNLVALTVATPPPPPPPPPHADAPAPQPQAASPPLPPADAPAVEPVRAAAPTDAPSTSAPLPWPSSDVPVAKPTPAATPAAATPSAAAPGGASPAATTPPATSRGAGWTSPEPPRPPTQHPTPWAGAGAATVAPPRTFSAAQVIAILGSAIVIVSSFLPWLEFAGDNFNTFDIPANFLRDATTEEGLKLGIGVLILGGLGIVTVFLRPLRWFSIVTGAVVIAVCLRFIQQADPLLDDLSDAGLDLGRFDVLEYGVYVAIAGGVLALVGGLLSLRASD